MRIAYFDCFAGISGDMVLGALVDAGADFAALLAELRKLHIDNYDVSCTKVSKRGLAATQVSVSATQAEHPHRGLSEITHLIRCSELPESIKQRATAIFARLGEAEAKVHGTNVENVQFHEVGAVDAIVDIVGACICLEHLGVERVYASAMPTFHGTVTTAHGLLPLPAPATIELLQGVPWREANVEGELVTPTGAAIISTLAERFGSMPAMNVTAIGCGAGKNDYGIPNVLRVFIGEAVGVQSEQIEVTVIETNIDDLNPQIYEVLIDRLLAAGALDVYLTPVQMKKNRPGTLVSIICGPQDVSKMADILFEETTTIGLRTMHASRICLAREPVEVQTRFGPIKVKVSRKAGRIANFQPEYEDCKAAAAAHQVPIKMVMDEASAAFAHTMATCPDKQFG